MNWRALAAPVALLLVLVGGNALVAQVQGDLQHQLDLPAEGEAPAEMEGSLPPLKLNNLKLPENLEVTLPDNLKLDPEDLSKLTLPDGMDVELPEGFDLSNLDFNLPEDFDLHLPEGSIFDPRTGNLSLPSGGRFTLPNGENFDLPPGTNLTLPPELVERLMQQGLPAGELSRDMSFRVEDLPPGLNVKMDPPALQGDGEMRFPPGTEIILPDGTRIPPEALAGLAPFILPEGTVINMPPGSGEGFNLPEDGGERRPPVEEDDAPPEPPRVPVVTDIDTWPERIEKGRPFNVQGYVLERSTGRNVVGAPVVVYMNATKETSGTLVGRGTTDASGRFDIRVTLPNEKPAGQWQLVNHAGAFTSADGKRYASGWGDPPISTFASTAWTLTVPPREGLQGATPIRALLVDSTGAPVPGARVELFVDDVLVRQGGTDGNGVYTTTWTFTERGAHTVKVRFPGNDYYDPSESAERTIVVEDVALDVPAIQRVERGGSITLAGRLLISGVASPGEEVQIVVPWDPRPIALTTDSGGRFARTLVVPATASLGDNDVTFRAVDYGVEKRQRVEVWTKGVLMLEAPDRSRIDHGAPVIVRLLDLQGNPIAGQGVTLSLDGPGGATTERVTTTGGGVARTLEPPQLADGLYRIAASLDSRHLVEASDAERAIQLATLVVTWNMPETVVRGSNATASATLRFGGEPLVGESVGLLFFTPNTALTDGAGRVSFTLAVPPQAPLGPAVAELGVPAHAHRETADTRVVALPKLTIDAPADYIPGSVVRVNLTLVDDLGQPLAGHRVELAGRAGGWSDNRSIFTDAEGRWTGEFDTAGAARQELALAAHHAEQGDYMETSAAAATLVSAAAAGALSVHPLLWAVPLAVIGVGGGAAALAKRRRARAAAVPAAPAAPTATVLQAPGFDLDVGIPQGEPLVWGVGEPLHVIITPTGASAGRRQVRLQGAGGVDHAIGLEGGPQRLAVAIHEEGDARLTATRTDDPMAAAVHVDLRIVDYRKEIAREFDVLIERARAIESALDKRSTAQEVEWMLGHRLGPAAAEPLAEMALVMDVTNYSDAPVARKEYLRFVRALAALDPLLTRGGRA